MSARDLMRSSDSSQSQQEATRFKIFDNSEIPICIRNSSGVFVYSNHNFSNVIKGCEYDSAYWFEKLPLEIKCLLLASEVEALANADVAMIKSVIIEGSFYWCVLFQVIHINSEIFIAWSFLKDVVFSSLNSKCISYAAGDVNYLKNPALVLEPGVYQSFCLFFREVAIKWSAAPDMTPQTVLYRRPVAQFSNFQPKIVSSWLILALFQANFLISGRSRLCPYQLVNSNQVRQGE